VAEDNRLGGTCVNRGCIPKKLYSYAAHYAEDFEDAAGFGWTVGERSFDWSKLVAAKEKELTRLGGERNRLLAAGGYSTDRAGMERCLREHAAQAVNVANAWRQLLNLTQAAHAANTTNGMIIATRLQHTQRALNAIFSSARMPGAYGTYGTYGAYGADGNTVSLRTTQQLAVA
jgi:flagellar biosynthesis/type III secretory pathway chaperone